MTIVAHTPDPVTTARAALDRVHTRIADVLSERESLLLSCRDDFLDAGVATFMLRASKPLDVEVVECYETFESRGAGTLRRVDYRPADPSRDDYGPWAWKGFSDVTMFIEYGRHRVVLTDRVPGVEERYDVLLVQEPQQDTEASHRRAVARLRTLARHDSLRVHVRDREVTLIDPMNNVIHKGDVVTAFAFLLNLDLENAEAV